MSSTNNPSNGWKDQRPEFMSILGLLPPYTLDDVKKAYLDKVRTAHPDHGGDIATFRVIQAAYEEAQRYVEFRSDKRSWIAAQIDRYAALQKLEEQLRDFGAAIEYQETDWLERSYGDFAELTSSVQAIKLRDSSHGREVARILVAGQSVVGGLKHLELVRCGLTDDSVLPFSCFRLLEFLDLSGNSLSGRVTALARDMPALKEFQLEGVSVGIWNRIKLTLMLRKRSPRTGVFSR